MAYRPAGREASTGVGAPVYERHRPVRTLLYQLVQEYYPAFKAHLSAIGHGLADVCRAGVRRLPQMRPARTWVFCGCVVTPAIPSVS